MIAPELATAALALAHVYERADQPELAAQYFRETLQLVPTEDHAHAGLARLAGDTQTAMHHWQSAAAVTQRTQEVAWPLPFAKVHGLSNHQHASMRWAECALELGDDDALLQALCLAIPCHRNVAVQICRQLVERHRAGLLLRIAAIHEHHWPEFPMIMRQP